jgi:phage baseplate assembly protein W
VANSENLTTDIRIELEAGKQQWRPLYRVASRTTRPPGQERELEDLDVVAASENLAQAVILRLMTPLGQLGPLGHPEYGSRLHELVGGQGGQATRNLMRLYILESLRGESRIEKVEQLTVEPAAGARGAVTVRLVLKPVGGGEPTVVGPLVLEMGP